MHSLIADMGVKGSPIKHQYFAVRDDKVLNFDDTKEIHGKFFRQGEYSVGLSGYQTDTLVFCFF